MKPSILAILLKYFHKTERWAEVSKIDVCWIEKFTVKSDYDDIFQTMVEFVRKTNASQSYHIDTDDDPNSIFIFISIAVISKLDYIDYSPRTQQ